MIILDEDVGNTVGWLGFDWEDIKVGRRVHLTGYPGDKPFRTMWHAACPLTTAQGRRMELQCDSYFGMSGGPIYFVDDRDTADTDDDLFTVWGPLTAEYTGAQQPYNIGRRLTESVVKMLVQWKTTH